MDKVLTMCNYVEIAEQPEPAYANPPKQRFYVNEMGERPSRYFP